MPVYLSSLPVPQLVFGRLLQWAEEDSMATPRHHDRAAVGQKTKEVMR